MKKYKYVQTFTDRHGTVRHYFRYGNFRVPLVGSPGTLAFLDAYKAALSRIRLPEKVVRPAQRLATKLMEHTANGNNPKMGVYLLMLDEQVVYVGTSLNMPLRVAEHKTNGRQFNRAFYIATSLTDRYALEKILIKAIRPVQNRQGLDLKPRKAV